ncbi:hypothetical protein ACFX1Z_026295 [Malus domestica]
MRQRGEDLNWFPRPTALYKFRSCRVLFSSDSSNCKKNIVVPILGSLLSTMALLQVIVLLLVWKLRRIRKPDGEKHNKTPVASMKSQFTCDEVLEITENFQTEIGKGGFGIVYHVANWKMALKLRLKYFLRNQLKELGSSKQRLSS